MSEFPFLSVLTLAPLVGALVVAFIPQSRSELAKMVALGWSLVVLVLSVVMWIAFEAGGDRFQFRESYAWIPQWGVRFTFAADGIALVMLMLIAVLVPLVILASWHDAEGSRRSVPIYFALLLCLESTMIGVFAAADVFLFYVFFEVMLVPMYFIIGSYGGARRQYAAVKFFLYSLVGGLFMLAAVVGLWVVGGKTFDWQSLTQITMSQNTERWLFLGFFIAFAVKAPFFPFHTWLPDAGGAAPAGAAALLVGVLDKVGTFGILRYCLPLFPKASRWFAPRGAGAGGDRHHLRRVAGGRPERPEAPGVVHVDRALRLHRRRHLRLHHPGRHRLGALHGQPRSRDRPALPGRRHVRGPARLRAGQ